jgi:hypothetical protein
MRDLIKREDFKEIFKVSLIEETKKLLDESEAKAGVLKERVIVLMKEGKAVIQSQDQQVLAAEILNQARENLDTLESCRKIFAKPLLDNKKKIDDVFAEYKTPFSEIVNACNLGLRSYQEALEKARREEEAKQRKKAEKAAEQGKPLPMTPPPAAVEKTVQTDSGKVVFRDHWIAEITDKTAAVKYFYENGMMEMLEINQTNLNQMAKQIKNQRAIPGVLIRNDKVLSR